MASKNCSGFLLISYMMEMAESVVADYVEARHLIFDSPSLTACRRESIRWMNEVSERVSLTAIARHTAVQIFDKFLIQTLLQNPAIEIPIKDYYMLAACSMVIGSKINDIQTPLKLTNFPHWPEEQLTEFEHHILRTIEFNILPQVTPASFVAKFMELSGTVFEQTPYESVANDLISQFLEEPEALMFAPSTIAVAAVLLTFVHSKKDITSWLSDLPDAVLPTPDNPSFSSIAIAERRPLFDLDGCLRCFQKLMGSRVSSPTTLKERDEKLSQQMHGTASPALGDSPTSVVENSCDCDEWDLAAEHTIDEIVRRPKPFKMT